MICRVESQNTRRAVVPWPCRWIAKRNTRVAFDCSFLQIQYTVITRNLVAPTSSYTTDNVLAFDFFHAIRLCGTSAGSSRFVGFLNAVKTSFSETERNAIRSSAWATNSTVVNIPTVALTTLFSRFRIGISISGVPLHVHGNIRRQSRTHCSPARTRVQATRQQQRRGDVERVRDCRADVVSHHDARSATRQSPTIKSRANPSRPSSARTIAPRETEPSTVPADAAATPIRRTWQTRRPAEHRV